jgi:hypothetical protein
MRTRPTASKPPSASALWRCAGRLPLVAEVLGYVGAVIAITAIVVTIHQIWKHVPIAVEMATAGVIAVGLLLAGAALRTIGDPALARLRCVLWLLSTASATAFVAVLTGRYLPLADVDRALMTAATAVLRRASPTRTNCSSWRMIA